LVKDHEKLVEWVVTCHLEAALYIKPEKCDLHKTTFKYLSLIISTKQSSIDQDNLDYIQNLFQVLKPTSGCLNNFLQLQQFLRF